MAGEEEPDLGAAVESVGRWWAETPYFAEAEVHMETQWRKLVLPFLQPDWEGISWSVVVELEAGRSRSAAKL